MEERRFGDGEPERPPWSIFSVLRFFQKRRGEVEESRGEDWNGEESLPGSAAFLEEFVCQLGEFRLFSLGEISLKGRGKLLAIFLVGEEAGVFLEIRRGCTGSEAMVITAWGFVQVLQNRTAQECVRLSDGPKMV